MNIRMTINGRACDLEQPPLRRLLDVLREELRLTGTKEGCGEGECGACTVLIDGVPVNSCLVPIGQMQGCEVRTIESLAEGGVLSDVQQALVVHGGAQCGICTPGIAMCATAALAAEPEASRERLRELMAGNLCRCTGYQRIVDAVVDAQMNERPNARAKP